MGTRVVELQGSSVTGLATLFEQLSKQFQFPAYFHQSWDSLLDCLLDLKIDTHAIVLINDANTLRESIGTCEFLNLVEAFVDAAEEWAIPVEPVSENDSEARSAKRFDCVLMVADSKCSVLREVFDESGFEYV